MIDALAVEGVGTDSGGSPKSPGVEQLLAWRQEAALRMGVLPWEVLPESACRIIDDRRPASLLELARIPGLGPRCLFKFGDDILRIIREASSPLPGVDGS